MSKILAKKWREIPPEVKQQYQEEERGLRQEYKEAMAKWRAEVEAPIEERRQEAIRLADMKLSSEEEHSAAAEPTSIDGTNSGNKTNLNGDTNPVLVGDGHFHAAHLGNLSGTLSSFNSLVLFSSYN